MRKLTPAMEKELLTACKKGRRSPVAHEKHIRGLEARGLLELRTGKPTKEGRKLAKILRHNAKHIDRHE